MMNNQDIEHQTMRQGPFWVLRIDSTFSANTPPSGMRGFPVFQRPSESNSAMGLAVAAEDLRRRSDVAGSGHTRR